MAEAIVSIVVGRLNDLLIEEPQLLGGLLGDEIQQVVTKLMWINTFLGDAYSRLDEHRIRILLAEIRDGAYEAEHVVESFIVKAASFSTGKTTPNTIKFIKKLKDIQRKMSVLSNRFNEYNIRSTQESSNSSYETPGKLKRFYSYTTVEPEIFVGFQKDLDLLVRHLVDESDESYPLISICGMGGLGKTTLAEKIYNHPTIKSHFAGLAWVSISQKWQTKNVLQRVLICLVHEDKDEILTWNDDKLAERLLQIQQQKKCLIVLDDIWSTDAWDSLKAAFPVEKSISKLMLTTRNDGVTEHVNSKGFVHQPKYLTADQSWELLEKKALPRGDYLDFTRDVKKMEELGREMVRKCGGLPLAIIILGGILVTKPTLSEWQKVYYDSQSSLKRGEGLGEVHQNELFDILVRGYKDLPTRLKPCFLYIGKFGEDEWVDTETLYQLWIAEGMVLRSDRREGQTMMQVAESYLGELVHRNMVQVRFYNVESLLAKFEWCSLHDLMRDLSRNQAKTEGFYEVIDLQEGNDFYVNPVVGFKAANSRQLVLNCEKYTSKKTNTYVVKKLYEQEYRSLLIVGEHYQQGFRSVLVSNVSRFKFLRVCALTNDEIDQSVTSSSNTLFRMRLGKVLGSLVYLRYLSVNYSDILVFPSIQKLVLLQTLNLEKPYLVNESIYIPSWMSKNVLRKLQCLRHLYLPASRAVKGLLGKNSKLRFDGLSKLETLENFNTSWCEVKDLQKLTSLQKLTLRVEGGNNELEEMIKHLSALALSSSSCLKELGLGIRCHNMRLGSGPDHKYTRLGSGPDMLRKLMSDHTYTLSTLDIFGRIPELGELFLKHQHQHQQQQQDEYDDEYKFNCGQHDYDYTHHHLPLTDVSLLRITTLSLVDTHLEADPMPYLEKIPTLCHLVLYDDAYVGNEMVCSATGFPKLTRLCLWRLRFLKKWRVEEGSMPILDVLDIRECGFQLEEEEDEELLKEEEEGHHLSSLASLRSRVRIVNDATGLEFYNNISNFFEIHPL